MNTQPTAAYQRALFGAAAALIGVLALYVGLVVALVALTVWHGMAHLDWVRGGTGGFLLYGTPIFIGAVLTLFLYLGHYGITLTRHFLRLLMLMGHAACCRLLRQMEFDADQHEIRSLHPIVRAVTGIASTLHTLEGLHDALYAVLRAEDRCRDENAGRLFIDHTATQIRAHLRTLLPPLSDVRHPYLSQPGEPVTVREAIQRESTVDDGFRGAHAEAAAVRELVPDLHSRALARLTALAYEAEHRARIGG